MPKRMPPGYRAFTILESSVGDVGGRYVARTPGEAARRMGRKRLLKKSGAGEVVSLTLKDITRMRKSREYKYELKEGSKRPVTKRIKRTDGTEVAIEHRSDMNVVRVS
jgi:hypothetical protein